MNVVICGTRNKGTREDLLEAIEESGFDITAVGSGGAVGPDQRGIWWADNVGRVPVKLFRNYNRSKEMDSSSQIIGWADAVIALWDGESKNTKNTIEEARARGRQVFVKEIA